MKIEIRDREYKNDLYLRFTKNPDLDIIHKTSRWYEPEEFEGSTYDEETRLWYTEHDGLSGHQLNANSIEEAIEEVTNGVWFGFPKFDDWAIFEDTGAFVKQDTPEGDTFRAKRVLVTCTH